ncbi:YdcF family protein [Sphingorhabdus sp.]|uniref:YdcF family protein n=1 Tax=Sphingorhabdus sp. TaxID=1902408 RepID=UPI00359304E3
MVQLREIPKRPRCPALDPEDEEQLTELCFYLKLVDDADVIFVFGNNIQHNEQSRLVAAICQNHPRASLVLTGGKPNYSENLGDNRVSLAESEALYQSLAQSADVGDRNIFLERRSQNTLENVAFAANHIRSLVPKTMVYLSQSFAQGRSAMTLRAQLPEIVSVGSMGMDRTVEGELLTSSTWTQSAILRDVIWGEFLRMVTYSVRGDIDPGPHSLTISQLAWKYLK